MMAFPTVLGHYNVACNNTSGNPFLGGNYSKFVWEGVLGENNAAFTSGNPFLVGKLLENSIGRGFGSSERVKEPHRSECVSAKKRYSTSIVAHMVTRSKSIFSS